MKWKQSNVSHFQVILTKLQDLLLSPWFQGEQPCSWHASAWVPASVFGAELPCWAILEVNHNRESMSARLSLLFSTRGNVIHPWKPSWNSTSSMKFPSMNCHSTQTSIFTSFCPILCYWNSIKWGLGSVAQCLKLQFTVSSNTGYLILDKFLNFYPCFPICKNGNKKRCHEL